MSFIQIGSFFSDLFKKLFGPKPKLAMLGDSLIANLATTGWQKQLQAPFNTALNLGVHGDTTAGISTRIPKIPAGMPVLLEGGANDIAMGQEANLVSNYRAILNAIPVTNKVILLGMARFDETIGNGAAMNTKIAAYNGLINALAASYSNVTVATAAQKLSMVGLTMDGAHPSLAGYLKLTNLINPLV